VAPVSPSAVGEGRVTGLVLAAGAGRRLGRPKAEVMLHGMRLIDRAVSVLRDGGCQDVVAVVRSADVTAAGARSVVNPDPDAGMGRSLGIGLEAVTDPACVIILVDQIGIKPSDIGLVIAAHRRHGSQVVLARRQGKRSHPVLVPRRLFSEFAAAAVGDQGARAFIDARPDSVEFLDLPDQIRDIDTPQDLIEVTRTGDWPDPGPRGRG
jgi:CTP:molybdopterin cytidylyltransferase MocA